MAFNKWINKSFDMASQDWRQSGSALDTFSKAFCDDLEKSRKERKRMLKERAAQSQKSSVRTHTKSSRRNTPTFDTEAVPPPSAGRPSVPSQIRSTTNRSSMPPPPDMSSVPPEMFRTTTARPTRTSGRPSRPTQTAGTTTMPTFVAGPGGQTFTMPYSARRSMRPSSGMGPPPMGPPPMGAGSMPFAMPPREQYEEDYSDDGDAEAGP